MTGDIEQCLDGGGNGRVMRAPSAEMLAEAESTMPAEEIAAVDELESLVVSRGDVGVGTNGGTLAGVEEGYGSMDSSSGEASKKKKMGRKESKAVIDMLKIDMASERTFFKWFRTGMQIGAVGTFVFLALDPGTGGQTLLGMLTVGFTWIIGFVLVLYGLYEFKSRRRAVRSAASGEHVDTQRLVPEWAREHAPTMVVVALVLVVAAGLLYAALLGEVPSKHKHGRDKL